MSIDSSQDYSVGIEEVAIWPVRAALWLERWLRPAFGWGALLICMALAALPAVALRANQWLALGSLQTVLEWLGPLAVAATWLVWGWRTEQQKRREPVIGAARGFGIVLLGAVVVSQLLLTWAPGPARVWQALQAGTWSSVLPEVLGRWSAFGERSLLWWQGVQAGGAAQDNLVFGALAGGVIWLLGVLTGWLARRTRQGYAAAVPSLWLLGTILLYGTSGRHLLIIGLALTIFLQLLFDHGLLVKRWTALRLDYSPGLLLDRVLSVLSAAVLVLTVAAVMPNLYFMPLVRQYYVWIAPLNEQAEAFAERLFPDMRASSRLHGGGLGEGMPNEFLLQGGPAVSQVEVMRVRTNEAAVSAEAPYEEAAPPGRYMRGGTLTVYDGRGWSNLATGSQKPIEADTRWTADDLWGRKLVVQSVILDVGSALLYAAPEPVEVSVAMRLHRRGDEDLIAMYSRERSYTVISAVPAVDEAMLRDLPEWGAALPPEMAMHLELPETVTERTRALAAEIVAGRPTAFDRASAIESYLRQYEYDLDVPAPPDGVIDVADYFLFDLQRGYCDYYATAFVVLARLAGLPTRFATGFAPGKWVPMEHVFSVTEAEAHSWPEVYFPQVGWVQFEPTAGRSPLTRIAAPQFSRNAGGSGLIPAMPALPDEPARWNWETALWLAPLALLVWGGAAGWINWQRRREDPWLGLMRWGRQAGRPIEAGETVLEYGSNLADYVLQTAQREADAGRNAAREMEALSDEVSALRYGPEDIKPSARARAVAHWERLRQYLRRIRVG